MKMRTFLSLLVGSMSMPKTTETPRGSKRYLLHRGNGHAVSVFVIDHNLDRLSIELERKIECGDVVKGRLMPSTTEIIKHRGGKRWTGIKVSYEDAEALYDTLGRALKDVRKRRADRDHELALANAMGHVMSYFAMTGIPEE